MTETYPQENDHNADSSCAAENTDNSVPEVNLNISENVTSLGDDLDTEVEQIDDHAVLVALQQENIDMKDKMLRALAEVENIRRRSEKEREDTAKYAITKFARDILSVADNLRRALDAIPEENRAEDEQLQNIFVGVEATEKELLRAFDMIGIKKIMPMDEPFNANFHEVMFEADFPDKTPGHVIEILEPGYMLHDRLLRPARVGVVKKAKLSDIERVDEEA